MPLYLISRPRSPEGEAFRNHAGVHAALISAASSAAAITAANVLAAARGVNAAFSTGWTVTDIATTPGGDHVDTLFDGDAITIRGVDRGGNPA
jgi:hypothetical protein